MKFLEFLLIFFLIGLLVIAGYILWLILPGQTVEFGGYDANISSGIVSQSQFYPNMRYPTKEISFKIDSGCSAEKASDVREALSVLQQATVLSFYPTNGDAEINILCSDIAPTAGEEGHFVAGEGGPSEVLNSSSFSVILSGRIALYREESCDKPQVALHEILHALGFEHNDNQRSIMYPVTNCRQVLDQYIIDEINELYSIPSNPDLIVEEVEASKSGIYFNFEVIISNFGLVDSGPAHLTVFAEDKEIKSFDFPAGISIERKTVLTVQSLKIPRSANSVAFLIETDDQEISKENNRVELSITQD